LPAYSVKLERRGGVGGGWWGGWGGGGGGCGVGGEINRLGQKKLGTRVPRYGNSALKALTGHFKVREEKSKYLGKPQQRY